LLSYVRFLVIQSELALGTSIIAGSNTPAPTLPSFALASSNPIPTGHPAPPKPTALISVVVPTPHRSEDALPLPSNRPALNATVTDPPSASHPPSSASGSSPAQGADFGNVVFKNKCSLPLYFRSEGAWPLYSFRDIAISFVNWVTANDSTVHAIAPGSTSTEPYRVTCPIPTNWTRGYCWSHDKLYGQGVSMKISYNEASSDVPQFEYALSDDLNRPGHRFQRLEYDVSLLDCANPLVYPKLFKVNVPPPVDASADIVQVAGWRDATALMDEAMSDGDHKIKMEKCPGYQGGITVSFPSYKEGVRKLIKCDDVKKCFDIYTFDRTREVEASMSCETEYKGDTVVEFCAVNKK
jgi:hypothetical protein